LVALGFALTGDPAGTWGPATDQAVRQFQERKGLRVDGSCGEQTWNVIVEAGYHLGDRRLYQRKPMMRGDDIADLQRRLGAMGFDAGKVDGIFGPDTAAAVADYQRNAGLTVDGIFGPDELRALERVGGRGDAQVAELRELATLRWSARTLDDRIFAVAERGGLDALINALGRRLGRLGAQAVVLHHPDGSQLAAQANAAGAEVFVELAMLVDEPGGGCRCAYYRTEGYTSPAGQRLAELVLQRAAAALQVPGLGLQGMVIPVLRETRMPAVVCEVGPSDRLVERAPAVVNAVAEAVVSWATAGPA
jgi:N-acetylmuramoyl-L-alanine amidase